MGRLMLELRHVSKRFSGSLAVDNVSFRALPGEVTGYLGPNGSGKSTTMKMIAGLIETTSGEILFDGRLDPARPDRLETADGLCARGAAPIRTPLGAGIPRHGRLSCGTCRREPTADRIDGLLRLLALHDDRHVAVSAYSKGMRQKVLVAAALLHNPDVLLLDEPFSGLDVGTALVLRSLIQELAGRGKVVLFSSHELETVERVCSHVVILHRGKVVADDSIEHLRTLMALSTLEEIFSQLAVEQDTVAVSRQIADLIQTRDTRHDEAAVSRPLPRFSFSHRRSGVAVDLREGRREPAPPPARRAAGCS